MVTYFPLSYPILILIDEQEYEVGEVLSFGTDSSTTV